MLDTTKHRKSGKLQATKTNSFATTQLRSPAAIAARGPTDWTHLGLKSKHRDEKNREEAWRSYSKTQTLSTTVLFDMQSVLPVVKVDRHPIHQLYSDRLIRENYLSNERTRSRLLMKRFVFDVQELWLANLEHLREHRPDQIFSGEDANEADNYQRGRGLEHRRDVREITAMNHQIQAVSQKRAFSNAYHTTRLPLVNIVLDYVPFRTPLLPPLIPNPPRIKPILQQLNLEPNSSKFKVLDGPVCNSTASFCLNIDRLIPSLDYRSLFNAEVLWRLELIETSSLTSKTFICKENDVALVAVSSATTDPNARLESCLIWSTTEAISLSSTDGLSTWQTTQVRVVGNINRSTTCGFSPIHFILEVELVCAETSSNEVFGLRRRLSPFEVVSICFQDFDDRFPSFNIDWWCQHSSSLWSLVLDRIRVACVRRVPQSLQVVDADTYHLVSGDGNLTELDAKSAAFELLQAMHWVYSPSRGVELRVDGLPLMDVTERRFEKSIDYKEFTREKFLNNSNTVSATAMQFGLWEELLEFGTCLTMFANSWNGFTQDVPGSCEFGKQGVWTEDAMHPGCDPTRAAARFFRDPMKSSTDTIMVNMAIALETTLLFPSQVAWENFSLSPPPYPGEESSPLSTLSAQYPWSLQSQELRSPLETRICNTIVSFGTFPVEGIDYLPKDVINRPVGFKRFVPSRNEFGFREQTETTLLSLNAHVDSHVYGITRQGAVSNNLGVNSRNIWHNVTAISEHINR
jgi:hypothetical protein